MEVLVPVFVAVLLAEALDPPARLATVLRERFGRSVGILLGATLAHLSGFAVAAAGGAWLAPGMNPDARALLLALALVAAGTGGIGRPKLADRLGGWRIGSFLTSLLGIFILAFGDRSQFLAFGFALWGASPVLAAAGATAAAVLATGIALTLGEGTWIGWAGRPIRLAVSGLFLVSGVVIGAGALRLT